MTIENAAPLTHKLTQAQVSTIRAIGKTIAGPRAKVECGFAMEGTLEAFDKEANASGSAGSGSDLRRGAEMPANGFSDFYVYRVEGSGRFMDTELEDNIVVEFVNGQVVAWYRTWPRLDGSNRKTITEGK